MITGRRTIDCNSCQSSVTFPTEDEWTKGRKVICEACGHVCIDHAEGERIAEERISLEEAQEIIAPYTHEQIIALAERAYCEPASITPDEFTVVAAYVRMRAAKANRH